MNIKTISFLVAVLTATLSYGQLAPRLVLLEHFTQASCGPCATYNPAVEVLMSNNEGTIIDVKYQTSWPGYDPMYNQNPTDPNTRVSYYSVNGVPNSVLDGNTYNGHPSGWNQSNINLRAADSSAFLMTIEHTMTTTDSVFIDVTIEAVADISGTFVLQTLITEKLIEFDDAPGTNGETEFRNVTRAMLPSATGVALENDWTIGMDTTISLAWSIEKFIYDRGRIQAVAFVQNNATKRVEQAAIDKSDITFTLESIASEASLLAGEADTANFTVEFNTTLGVEADYNVAIDNSELPSGYEGWFEVDGTKYTDNAVVTLPANSTTNFDVFVKTNTTLNQLGSSYLVINPVDTFPQYKEFVSVTAIGKINFLYANKAELDGGNTFKTGLALASESYVTLSEAALKSTSEESLTPENVFAIVYNIGYDPEAITGAEAALLMSYLDKGGNLFITGQTIGDNVDKTSNVDKILFYNNYLGASYLGKGTNETAVNVTPHPDDKGLFNTLSDAQLRAVNGSTIEKISNNGDESHPIAYYDNKIDELAGVRNGNDETFKVVYFPFLFETFSASFGTSAFTNKAINLSAKWFRGEISSAEFDIAMAEITALYPNPINVGNDATIEFEALSNQVELTITDVQGRTVVSNVLNVATGKQVLTIPTSSLTKGIYVVNLSTNGSVATSKLSVN
jgi:hypothetical protein